MAEKPSSEKKKGGNNKLTTRLVAEPSNYVQLLSDRLVRLDQRAKEEKFDPRKHKDTKRSQIALIFVWGYMIIVAITIIGGPIYNAFVLEKPVPLDVERILSQVGSLIGAPLGFVIGYYFKEDR